MQNIPSRQGYQYVFCVVDHISKMRWVLPMATKESSLILVLADSYHWHLTVSTYNATALAISSGLVAPSLLLPRCCLCPLRYRDDLSLPKGHAPDELGYQTLGALSYKKVHMNAVAFCDLLWSVLHSYWTVCLPRLRLVYVSVWMRIWSGSRLEVVTDTGVRMLGPQPCGGATEGLL